MWWSWLGCGAPPDPDACGRSGVCALEVRSVEARCGDGDPFDRSPRVSADADGERVLVTLHEADIGCCDEVVASATADVVAARIDVELTLVEGMCDCVCALDESVDLAGVPPGAYEVVVNGEEGRVRVP